MTAASPAAVAGQRQPLSVLDVAGRWPRAR